MIEYTFLCSKWKITLEKGQNWGLCSFKFACWVDTFLGFTSKIWSKLRNSIILAFIQRAHWSHLPKKLINTYIQFIENLHNFALNWSEIFAPFPIVLDQCAMVTFLFLFYIFGFTNCPFEECDDLHNEFWSSWLNLWCHLVQEEIVIAPSNEML